MFFSKFSVRDLLVLSLLTICCVIFTWQMLERAERVENDIINVEVREGIKKEVVFKKLDLAPGDSCDYTILLDREENVSYEVSFQFQEMKELDLKKYVYVKLETHDVVFYEGLLADAFEDEAVTIHIDHTKDKCDEIKVTYYLPEEVGNEAQSAKSEFMLLVTADGVSPLEGEVQ